MERTELIRLVKGAQAGDSTAIEDLFAAFYNDVYYFAIKTVKDEDLACDITQEAFVEVFRTIGNLKEPAAFVKWMKEITYHQCTRYFRKKKEVLVDEDEEGFTVFDTLADESTESLPAEVYENTEFRGTVMDIVNELTEEQRAAVLLHYFDDLSVKEIAAIQGVSEGTVKSRLNYARKAIRKSVNDYEEKHNIKLHALGFLPLLHLAFGEASIPAAGLAAAKAAVLAAAGAAGAGAAAGGAGGAAAASAKTAGMGIGAKIAAMPVVTKIIAGVTAAAVALGGGWLVAKQVFHEDFNLDCYCDFCGEFYAHHQRAHHLEYCFVCGEPDGNTSPEHHAHCVGCGEPIYAYHFDPDATSNQVCDICGEYSCGELHGMPHSYVEGVCEYCGIAEGLAESGTETVVETEEEEQAAEPQGIDYRNHFREGTLDILDTAHVTFTNIPVPEGVEAEDISYLKDGSVMMWKEPLPDEEGLYHMYITTTDGGVLYAPESISGLFYEAELLRTVQFDNFDTSHVTDMSSLFDYCVALEEADVSGFDTSNVTNMFRMFGDCESLAVIDTSGFDTSNVTDMRAMFSGCYMITSFDLTNFDTSKVTDMGAMFSWCANLTEVDLSSFNTSNVENFGSMFDRCFAMPALDLSHFDTSKATDMHMMFFRCDALKTVDVSGWDTANVVDMDTMFGHCYSLEYVDVSGFDTSKVEDMSCMFSCCYVLKNVDVSGWNTSNAQTMYGIFHRCDALQTPDVSGWVIPEGEDLYQ